MKKLIIAGNLTKDVEVKTTQDGTVIATLSVAVNDRKETTFFTVEVWRGLAEACANNLSKGSAVTITAEVESNNYEKDGKKYYGYKFTADEVTFMGGPKKATITSEDDTASKKPSQAK